MLGIVLKGRKKLQYELSEFMKLDCDFVLASFNLGQQKRKSAFLKRTTIKGSKNGFVVVLGVKFVWSCFLVALRDNRVGNLFKKTK